MEDSPSGLWRTSQRDPFGAWKKSMRYYLYVLLSLDKMHWYIGSSNNIIDRLNRHNKGFSKSTKPYRPWEVIYKEEYKTRSEAVKREMFLKSPKGYQEYLSIKKNIRNTGGFA